MTTILEELIIHLKSMCALCHINYLEEKNIISKQNDKISNYNKQHKKQKKLKKYKAWVIHHRTYVKGEKSSKHFKTKSPHIITRGEKKGKKTTKTTYHKDEYYTYIKSIVLSNPARFAALHNSCHQSISKGARWSKKTGNRQRFCNLIMEQD